MKKSHFVFALLLAFAMPAFAQKKTDPKKEVAVVEEDPSGNLVTDAGFEVTEIKTLKSYNQLTTFLKSWGTPNQTSADLFNTGVKGTKAGAPVNDYGTQEPLGGTSYAGFRAYTKDAKKTRTYLQAKLSQKLEKDKLYCVRFNLSLSDLSKFGVNNVGIFFSDRKISNQHDNALTLMPQVTEKTNKPIVTMDGWETICGTILGSGKEEYIIIGGFGLEDNMKIDKVKKPAAQQGVILSDAYYYIDNIEIVPVEAQSQCFCGKTEDRDPDIIYSRSSAKSIDMKPAQFIAATSVWYSFLSPEIPAMFEGELVDVAETLKGSPEISIELIGHSDTDEMNEAKVNRHYDGLALKRAEAVKQFLVDNGVDASRITVSSKDNTVLASNKPTPMGKAQNRRVEFVVK